MKSFFRRPFDDVIACLMPIMSVRSPFKAMGPMMISIVVVWFLYVPVHELLHVAGCLMTGGEVTRLELSARYGANFLKEIFPFIVSGSNYAGQLTGFDTKGSDFIYLATDFLPFALSVLIGVPVIHFCMRGRRPILFGLGVVIGLAPFYNMPGDYYEMGSIMTTRVATWVTGSAPAIAFEGIRSDDIFSLMSDLFNDPGAKGIEGAGAIAIAWILVVVALAVDVLLAFLTYFVGGLLGRLIVRSEIPKFVMPARR
ncbi:MAG: hypothetical protein IH987_18535 [Planctomycetes bacterium]|nr:hypothetical protein [Planctomycetota bacterium]